VDCHGLLQERVVRPEDLRSLAERGWRFSRDGSTATARKERAGWEISVLLTLGHPPRWVLQPPEDGAQEQEAEELEVLAESLAETRRIMGEWRGQVIEEDP